jgi:hypothetical protein
MGGWCRPAAGAPRRRGRIARPARAYGLVAHPAALGAFMAARGPGGGAAPVGLLARPGAGGRSAGRRGWRSPARPRPGVGCGPTPSRAGGTERTGTRGGRHARRGCLVPGNVGRPARPPGRGARLDSRTIASTPTVTPVSRPATGQSVARSWSPRLHTRYRKRTCDPRMTKRSAWSEPRTDGSVAQRSCGRAPVRTSIRPAISRGSCRSRATRGGDPPIRASRPPR